MYHNNQKLVFDDDTYNDSITRYEITTVFDFSRDLPVSLRIRSVYKVNQTMCPAIGTDC